MPLFLAAVTTVHLFPTDGGFLDKLFHGTYVTVNIFGLLSGEGYKITLSGLIVILILSIAAAAIAERLAGAKPGKNLVIPVLITLLGSYIFTAYVQLPTDISIEGVRILAALLGAIVFSVFYVLISRQGKKA